MASFPPRVNEKEIGEERDGGRGVLASARGLGRGRDPAEEGRGEPSAAEGGGVSRPSPGANWKEAARRAGGCCEGKRRSSLMRRPPAPRAWPRRWRRAALSVEGTVGAEQRGPQR